MAWLSVNYKSSALSMPVVLDILIPEGKGPFKTLYLLHGAGGDHATWLMHTRIADYVDKKGIAVVMPAGNNKLYLDNLEGKAYHTFVAEELITWCETRFPLSNKREDRFIAGMSMGGYGAFYAAMSKCYYKAAFSYSGLMDLRYRIDNPIGIDFTPVFINKEEFDKTDFDLFKKSAENVDRECCYYMYCGLQDGLLCGNEQLYSHLKSLGYKVIFSKSEGSHDFDYWDKCIKQTVDIIAQGGELHGSSY